MNGDGWLRRDGTELRTPKLFARSDVFRDHEARVPRGGLEHHAFAEDSCRSGLGPRVVTGLRRSLDSRGSSPGEQRDPERRRENHDDDPFSRLTLFHHGRFLARGQRLHMRQDECEREAEQCEAEEDPVDGVEEAVTEHTDARRKATLLKPLFIFVLNDRSSRLPLQAENRL